VYFSSSLFIFEVISVNNFILASYFIIRIAVLDGDADEFEDEETAAEVHELKLNDDGNDELELLVHKNVRRVCVTSIRRILRNDYILVVANKQLLWRLYTTSTTQ